MREVPRRPSAEDLQTYQVAAATSLRAAIFEAIRSQDPLQIETYGNAATALADYTIARSRWLKYHQEEYL